MRAEDIKGWMRPAELAWIRAIGRVCHTIVEIGAHRGRSTRAWIDAMPADARIYVIDPWLHNTRQRYMGDPDYIAFQDNLKEPIQEGRIIVYRGLSQDCFKPLQEQLAGTKVDLVFIDGDHRTKAVELDIRFYRMIIRQGGILSGHDYGNPGVRRAIEKCGLSVKTTDSGTPQQIWWTEV
jgi:predicted O-methyltransferase YrrM